MHLLNELFGYYRICLSPRFKATVHAVNSLKALLCYHLCSLLATYAMVTHHHYRDVFRRLFNKPREVVIV